MYIVELLFIVNMYLSETPYVLCVQDYYLHLIIVAFLYENNYALSDLAAGVQNVFNGILINLLMLDI